MLHILSYLKYAVVVNMALSQSLAHRKVQLCNQNDCSHSLKLLFYSCEILIVICFTFRPYDDHSVCPSIFIFLISSYEIEIIKVNVASSTRLESKRKNVWDILLTKNKNELQLQSIYYYEIFISNMKIRCIIFRCLFSFYFVTQAIDR